MSNEIKGFKIKGQVYSISGNGTNGCFTCHEELAPLFEVKNQDYYKIINLQGLINYLTENFDHDKLIDDSYSLQMLINVDQPTSYISISKSGSHMYADFSSLGFGSVDVSSDEATPGVLGTLNYLIEKEYKISKQYDLYTGPDSNSSNIIKLYAYLGFSDSGWTGEYKPVSLIDIANFVEDIPMDTIMD